MFITCFWLFIAFLLSRPNPVTSGRKYINNLRNSLVSLTSQEKKKKKKRGTLINMQTMY